jgi:hypothetical protein
VKDLFASIPKKCFHNAWAEGKKNVRDKFYSLSEFILQRLCRSIHADVVGRSEIGPEDIIVALNGYTEKLLPCVN